MNTHLQYFHYLKSLLRSSEMRVISLLFYYLFTGRTWEYRYGFILDYIRIFLQDTAENYGIDIWYASNGSEVLQAVTRMKYITTDVS